MPRKKLSKVVLVIAIVALVIAGGFLAWWFLIRQPPIPHNIIALSGRIEGDDSTVATKVSGRIREIRVREGDIVKAGEVIALLDEEQASAREQQARSSAQEADTRIARSLSDVGFHSAVDLLSTYAGRKADLAPWLKGAQINQDHNLRLQYLAGMGLNLYQGRVIYDEMLRYRQFPEGLFVAPDGRRHHQGQRGGACGSRLNGGASGRSSLRSSRRCSRSR